MKEIRLYEEKILKLMRITLAQMVIAGLFASMSYAHPVLGQKVLEQKITLTLNDAPIKEVLAAIEKTSDVRFSYLPKQIQSDRKIDVQFDNVPLRVALGRIFKNTSIQYEAIGTKQILLSRQIPPQYETPEIEIVRVKENRINTKAFVITGTVTDEKGEPLVGASVVLEGTQKGALSDENGNFRLELDDKDKKGNLVVSFVGYEKQIIAIDGRGFIGVKLVESGILKEVVVVGYGTINRRDATGSVGSVAIEELKKAPVASFEEALGGRVAGVQVTSQSGQPGDGFQIVIRGNNSVTQDNSPLYVIDGFPIEGFNNSLLNPADIESIDVLKDASATAIYGARGANGVIIITTKQGKEGPVQISYQGYYGNSEISKKIPLLNAYEFVKLQTDIFPASATQQYLTRSNRTLDDYKNVVGVEMQDKMFRTAPMMNHYLNVRGGTAATKYSFSGNLFQTDGVIINSGYKRYQVNSSIEQALSKKVKVGLNFAYTHANTFGTLSAQQSQTAASGRIPGAVSPSGFLMYNVWGYRPVTGNEQDLQEELIDLEAIADRALAYNVNPYVQVQNELRERFENNLILNSFGEWSIFKQLKLRSTFGLNQSNNTFNNFNNSNTSSGNPITSPNGILVNGSVTKAESNNWSNENTLTYTNNFKKIHSLTALVGFSQQGSTTNARGFRAIQVPNESLGINGLDEGTPAGVTASASLWNLASFLTRVNYGFKSRYLFTANFRADGSSRFSAGNKWAYFPSGSFAWRFSDEPFLKQFKALSDGKLRMGYGRTGNNRVNDFAYLSTISTSGLNNTYSFGNGVPGTSGIQSIVGNRDLKWETTDQTNIGVDLSFFKTRLRFTADAYQKTTRDLLINATIPSLGGYSNILQNVGKVENKGLEFSLAYNVLKTRAFQWSSSFNISFNRNRIVQLADNQELITFALGNRISGAVPGSVSKINNPIGTFYGYVWDGVYGLDDFEKLPNGTYLLKSNITTNGAARGSIQPGDIKYRDLNGDLTISNTDATIVGNPTPKHFGGLSNNFQYKNFELNVFCQWSYGNQIQNVNRLIFEGGGEFPANLNQFATVANRWTFENTNTTMHRFRPGTNATTNIYSSRFVEDGSYLRLKTVNFAYNLPTNLLGKAKVRSMQVYVSAQNLMTWTKYSGYDPEVSVVSNALAPGIDFSSYPRNKTFTIGANVGF
jgi:TonB-dependent starch-binding outer membrane protein SusC